MSLQNMVQICTVDDYFHFFIYRKARLSSDDEQTETSCYFFVLYIILVISGEIYSSVRVCIVQLYIGNVDDITTFTKRYFDSQHMYYQLQVSETTSFLSQKGKAPRQGRVRNIPLYEGSSEQATVFRAPKTTCKELRASFGMQTRLLIYITITLTSTYALAYMSRNACVL